MLDPINALSLASNVVQVVDFSIKLVSKGYNIYKSADGALVENQDTEAVAIDLRMVNAKLSQSLYRARQTKTSPFGDTDDADDQALERLSESCSEVAEELILRLRKLKIQPGGKNREWKSVRQALKTVWSKQELNDAAARLKLYRDQLNTRILVSLRERLEAMDEQHAGRFNDLDQSTKKILSALLDHRSVFTNNLEIQTKLLSRLFISQNEETRKMLSATFMTLRARSPGGTIQPQITDARATSPQPDQNTPSIHDLTREGSLPKLRNLLRSHPEDINALDASGQSPLHIAATSGYLDVAKYLRRKGAELNTDDDTGQTPLHLAAIHSHEPLVRFLLTAGAEPDAEDDSGKTALDYSSDNFLISWMLKHGPSLESRAKPKNNTALIQAAWTGDTTSVRALALQGADLEARNKHQYTALMETCRHGHIDALRFLLSRGASKEARNEKEGWTPLLLGVWTDRIDVVKIMIEAGSVMETRTLHTGHTALCEALWKGFWDVARVLMHAGASVKAKDCSGYTPLNRAAMTGYVDDARFCLDKGADINALNKDGWAPLAEACHHGHDAIVSLLLSRRANIEVKDKRAYTPLCHAALAGRTSCVRLLLAAGANTSHPNIDGWTALAEASHHGFEEIAALLLTAGADPNIADNRSYTALCRAAQSGHSGVVRQLLAAKANTEAANREGWTALAEAAHHWGTEIITLLLDAGADIETSGRSFEDRLNQTGWTPTMHAAREGHEAAVSLLLDRGADMEAKTSARWTAFDVAVEYKKDRVAALLLRRGAFVDFTGGESMRYGLPELARALGERKEEMRRAEPVERGNGDGDGWEKVPSVAHLGVRGVGGMQ
jgi:ankyrin repeat protein